MTTNGTAPDAGRKKWAVAGALVLLSLGAIVASWRVSGSVDSSGFKPPVKVSAQELEKQIQDIRDNPRIPPAQKESVIAMIRMRADTQRKEPPHP